MGFERIADILDRVRRTHSGFGKRLSEAEALARWEAAVGAQISKHARAVKVHQGELWVEVDHPIWRSELHHRKKQILEILNQKSESTSEAVIQDIVFLDPRSKRSGC